MSDEILKEKFDGRVNTLKVRFWFPLWISTIILFCMSLLANVLQLVDSVTFVAIARKIIEFRSVPLIILVPALILPPIPFIYLWLKEKTLREDFEEKNKKIFSNIEFSKPISLHSTQDVAVDKIPIRPLSFHKIKNVVKNIIALKENGENAEFDAKLNDLLKDTHYNWEQILLLSLNLSDPSPLIEKLIQKNEKDSLTLAIYCLGNSSKELSNLNTKVFVKLNLLFHHSGQIPTYLVANELRGLRKNGIETLKIFLEKEYYNNNANLRKEIQPFISEVLTNSNINLSDSLRPYGMLRRSAIDTIGVMGEESSANLLISKLREYRGCEEDSMRNKQIIEANDWRHNQWHIAYALHRCKSHETVNFFNTLIMENLGVILKLEGYYHLLKFDGINSQQITNKQVFIKKIKSRDTISELHKALADDFKWSRAHACEVIYRIADCGKELNEFIYNNFVSNIKQLASAQEKIQIVRHYACYTLGKIGHYDKDLPDLLDVLVDETAKGWVKFSAVSSAESILHRYNKRIGDLGLLKLRNFVKRGVGSFNGSSKPTSEQIAVAVGIRLLSKYGTKKDKIIVNDYSQFDKELLVVGNFQALVMDALENLSA